MYPRLPDSYAAPVPRGFRHIGRGFSPLGIHFLPSQYPLSSRLHQLKFRRVCWMQVQFLQSWWWWWWSGRASGRLGGCTALWGSTHQRQPRGEGWNCRTEVLARCCGRKEAPPPRLCQTSGARSQQRLWFPSCFHPETPNWPLLIWYATTEAGRRWLYYN